MSYCGKQADLFASAVSLFMMIFQAMPFGEAEVNDSFYRLIAGNKPSYYWPIYEKKTPVSEELKDLLTGMIQYDA